MKNFRTMKSFARREDRDLNSFRSFVGSNLPRSGQTLLFISLLVLIPVFPANSCRKLESEENTKDKEKESLICRKLEVDNESYDCRHLDIFIYDESEKLESHTRFDSVGQALELQHNKDAKILVLVANSPYNFNLNSLSRYSSFSKLAFDFKDDSMEHPIMGGIINLDECREEAISVKLKALMSYVELFAVSCNLEDYDLLESPRVRLKNINASALIFHEGEYIASEFIDYGEWVSLPYDIGTYTQYPGIRLAAYPNEASEDSENNFPTLLEFECRIRGEKSSFEIPIESLERDSSVKIEIEISAQDEFSSKVY